ncbi:MAG: hypothetical protein IIV91_01275 [Alistipes sp.]|jgi:hypothetical protein|nr:hypothetical protein [Alistipes sp.]
MTLSLIIFGLLSGALIDILIGIIGSRRNIGFGWAFLLSIIFTPVVGLLITLISDPLPVGERRWGCIANLILICAILSFVLFVLALAGVLVV